MTVSNTIPVTVNVLCDVHIKAEEEVEKGTKVNDSGVSCTRLPVVKAIASSGGACAAGCGNAAASAICNVSSDLTERLAFIVRILSSSGVLCGGE